MASRGCVGVDVLVNTMVGTLHWSDFPPAPYPCDTCGCGRRQVCFTLDYDKEAEATVDYFTCDTCRINWVCEQCATSCHTDKGHTVRPYLKNHVPTFACCYCVKRRKCTIPNSKTRR